MSSKGEPVRQFPDQLLKQRTREAERVDEPVKRLIERLIAVMRRHKGCVGLAAPQIGSLLRVAVMDAAGHSKAPQSHGLIVLVNPRIASSSNTLVQREGCLSIPGFTANIRRAAAVRVTGFDEFGSSREWHLEGFEAIIAQHEVDHLDGMLFLDRVANLKTDVFRRKTYL
jgi:peptide deformylase